jgi:hypothetical protein
LNIGGDATLPGFDPAVAACDALMPVFGLKVALFDALEDCFDILAKLAVVVFEGKHVVVPLGQ